MRLIRAYSSHEVKNWQMDTMTEIRKLERKLEEIDQ